METYATSTAPFSAASPIFNQVAYGSTPTTTILYAGNHKLLASVVTLFSDRHLLLANY